MAVHIQTRRFTIDDYHKMIQADILTENDRVELLDGEIIEMSPIGSEHAGCINRINALLGALLGKKAILSIQNPLQIGEWSEPEPDIAILKPADHYYAKRHPNPEDVLLIIEVADSSLEYDREVKMAMYAKAGIPEYWIINLQQSELEAYRAPKENGYRIKEIISPEDSFNAESLDLVLEAADLLG